LQQQQFNTPNNRQHSNLKVLHQLNLGQAAQPLQQQQQQLNKWNNRQHSNSTQPVSNS
jgi:hypothetical protein